MYGIKQAPHEWNEEINSTLIHLLLFTRCKSDSCIYIKISKMGRIIILAIFVDDIVGAYHREDEQEYNELCAILAKKYTVKLLGDAEFILGMRIRRDRNNNIIYIDQQLYIDKLMKQFNMEQCNGADTPEVISNNNYTNSNDKELCDRELYQSIVGSLLYAAISTRVDICHAVNVLSRSMQQPTKANLINAKRILRYLHNNNNCSLTFKKYNMNNSDYNKNNLLVSGYSDADWGGDHTDRKSTTGFIIMVNNNIVSWISKKQSTVALSTAEAEYMAISAAAQEILWIRTFINEIICNNNPSFEPSLLFSDNQSAIAISNNDIHHNRTKHIDIKHHFIRDTIKQKQMKILWVNSENQLADICTKALPRIKFNTMKNKLLTIN